MNCLSSQLRTYSARPLNPGHSSCLAWKASSDSGGLNWLAFCWPSDLCLLLLVAKQYVFTGCPCCLVHSSTLSGHPVLGGVCDVFLKHMPLNNSAVVSRALGESQQQVSLTFLQRILSTRILFSVLFMFLNFILRQGLTLSPGWPQTSQQSSCLNLPSTGIQV